MPNDNGNGFSPAFQPEALPACEVIIKGRTQCEKFCHIIGGTTIAATMSIYQSLMDHPDYFYWEFVTLQSFRSLSMGKST